MCKKRILSLMLACIMVVCLLPAIASAESEAESVPEALTLSPAVADSYILNEDFSDNTYSGLIANRGDRAALSTESGKLKITHNGFDGSNLIGTRIYLNNDQKAKISDTLAVEFTVDRINTGETFTFKTEGDSVTGSHNHWDSSAVFTYDNTGTKSNRGTINGTKAKVTMLLNPALDRQSVRVESLEDTTKVVEIRNNTINGDLSECSHVDLFMETSSKDEYFYIDDLKIYEPNVPDYEAVLWDKEGLTEDEITGSKGNYNLTGALALPVTGEYGSTITWASSNISIISNEGVITNPGDDATVTMTATITKGGKSDEKTFEFKFGEVAYLSPVPAVAGEYIVNEDFSVNDYSELITARGDVQSKLSVEEGRLKVSYIDDSNKSTFGARIYLDSTHTDTFSELTAIEFTVERPTVDYAFGFKTEGPAINGMYNYWRETGRLWLYSPDTSNYTSIGDVNATKAKFTILLNPELNRQSVRVQSLENGTVVSEKRNHGVISALNTTVSLDLYLDAAATTNIGKCLYIDDLKIYKAKAPSIEAVAWDAELFAESDFLGTQTAASVVSDLTLPETGKYGSNITWTSSDENVITNDGKVKRGAEAKTVKLTATFSKGIAESLTKDFNLTVPAGELKIDDIAYDGTGYENGALKEGKVTVKLPVTCTLSDVKDVTVISAVYDKTTKKMLSAKSQVVSFANGSEQSASIELTIESTNNYIRTFVWNSLSELKPLIGEISLGE